MHTDAVTTSVEYASATGRWVVAAAVLGSGMAFLDSTVVNVALPAIGRDLGGGLTTLQWVLDGYLLTLSALLLLGGALGDRYGRRRIFTAGLVAFTLASLACGLAPNGGVLIAARAAQGVGGALLVPGSLALINATIRSDDRAKAVGAWAGTTGVATAVGPFLGGWLVDAVSWRWVFLINLPLAAVAVVLTHRHVPESSDETAHGRPDALGAVLITVGLAGLVYAAIEIPAQGWNALRVVILLVGIAGMVAFPLAERRQAAPMLPLEVFRSAQFTGANLTTFVLYGALGGALFLLALQLQLRLGYSALEAGVATLPVTIVMLLLSARIGALSTRIGARPLMTAGPIVAAVGLALMVRITPGSSYLTSTLPALVVFALGLATTVAPLTSTVLAAVSEEHVGAASGTNNAIARLASLLAVAVLPRVAGITGDDLGDGFGTAMVISAVLCAAGGVIAFATIRTHTPVRSTAQVNHGCQDPCLREERPAA